MVSSIKVITFILMRFVMKKELAIILPNTIACRTVEKVLRDMNLDYPVIRAAEDAAVDEAAKFIAEGYQGFLSAGVTMEYIKDVYPDVPMLELPFSGLEVAAAVQQALNQSDKIVHLGTVQLYHHIQHALDVFGLPKNSVSFRLIEKGDSIRQKTLDAINEGFEVFIGGYLVVETARQHDKIGLEVSFDELIIRSAIIDALANIRMINELKYQNEMQLAILQATSDGIIAVDGDNRIQLTNIVAKKILPGENTGKDFSDVMRNNHVVDIDKISVTELDPDEHYSPVIIKSSPIVLDGEATGSVYSVQPLPDFESNQYLKRNDLYVEGLWAEHTFDSIVGTSDAITLAKEKARVFANYSSPVLITGETGTGKEVFAQSIHNASRQKFCPWVPVNCASLPENLIESELFGYEKGAFTGASKEGKKGFFELADKGTILLDEISEIPISIQSKLLRVIQEGDVIRVGSNKIIHVDCRIICTSNKDLLQLIEEKKFKEDLYYRLNVLEIELPPLRDRREDIEPLAQIFLKKYSKYHHKFIEGFDPAVIEQLSRLPLSGNVRELSNIIERLVIFENQPQITLTTFYDTVNTRHLRAPAVSPVPSSDPDGQPETTKLSEAVSAGGGNLQDAQKEMIFAALERNNGNKAATARELGIDPSTLWRRLKKYGMQ